MMLSQIKKELRKSGNKEKAKDLQRFFKTGKGQYGQGDVFLGVMVPKQREIAKKYQCLDFAGLQALLQSKIHEERLIALLILVFQFQKADMARKEKIVKFYLKNTKRVNNWDLVDLSARKILGAYLLEKKDNSLIFRLAKSHNLWERRIAVLACAVFIGQKKFGEILKVSEMLLQDKEDLIHKAIGWMLREVGKRDKKAGIDFLQKNYLKMPRVMLRYAIEKFSAEERKIFLGKI